MRVFPLSNWTEKDIWQYIKLEQIPVVPIYFASDREVIIRDSILIPLSSCSVGDEETRKRFADQKTKVMTCRFRSLGCIPCTGAIASRQRRMTKSSRKCMLPKIGAGKPRYRFDQRQLHGTKKEEGYF